MSALNTILLQWISAGDEPNAWALLIGVAFAQWGSVLCAAAVIWAGWQRPTDRGYLVAVLLVAGLVSLLSHLVAAHLNYSRPFVLGIVPAYIAHRGTASLPSTHASVMFFIGFAFVLRPSLRRMGVFILALAAITGWARVYVGVHFPFDIAAGIGLAGVVALMFMWVVRFFGPKIGTRRTGGGHPAVADANAAAWRLS